MWKKSKKLTIAVFIIATYWGFFIGMQFVSYLGKWISTILAVICFEILFYKQGYEFIRYYKSERGVKFTSKSIKP